MSMVFFECISDFAVELRCLLKDAVQAFYDHIIYPEIKSGGGHDTWKKFKENARMEMQNMCCFFILGMMLAPMTLMVVWDFFRKKEWKAVV